MKVEYISHLGDDNHIAMCARTSFDKDASDFSEEQNIRLVQYLAREGHIMPFAHVQICLNLDIPVFLARQLMRSNVGVVYSEVSRRYVSYEPEVFHPEFRSRSENGNKQGSGEVIVGVTALAAEDEYNMAVNNATDSYNSLLALGIAPEQARLVLPQALYTRIVATGSLLYWSRVYNLRNGSGAQKEWLPLLEQLDDIISPIAPVAWAALTGKE